MIACVLITFTLLLWVVSRPKTEEMDERQCDQGNIVQFVSNDSVKDLVSHMSGDKISLRRIPSVTSFSQNPTNRKYKYVLLHYIQKHCTHCTDTLESCCLSFRPLRKKGVMGAIVVWNRKIDQQLISLRLETPSGTPSWTLAQWEGDNLKPITSFSLTNNDRNKKGVYNKVKKELTNLNS